VNASAKFVAHCVTSATLCVASLEPFQHPLTIEKVMAVSDVLSPDALREFMKEAARTGRKRGRPPSKRDRAIRALALQCKGYSWQQLTAKLCDCGRQKHDEYCRDRIRTSARALEKVLRRHGVFDEVSGRRTRKSTPGEK